MKPNALLPVATALIGFSLAWIAKPGGTTVAKEAEKTEPAAMARSPGL